jgi:hypothetical protein
MKNSEFKRKIDGIAKNIAEAQDITPDAKRFQDKLNSLANTLDPVINSISTTKELEDVILMLIDKMAQIDKVEAKTALANVIRKLNAGETGEMSPDIPPTTMNEAVTRWQKLAGIITENNLQELTPATRNIAAGVAAGKSFSDDPLTRNKANSQYKNITQVPTNLKVEGERIGKMIADKLGYPESEAKIEKVIYSPEMIEKQKVKNHIIYNVDLKRKRSASDNNFWTEEKNYKVVIYLDKYTVDPYSVKFNAPNISTAILRLIKNLQEELKTTV